MKIVSVVGARPQFIKCAMVSSKLRRVAEEILVHTGQHYDYGMSGVFFDELHLPAPDHHLEVGSGSHGWQTGQMLAKIEEVLRAEKPDWILLFGDTNSTLAGALAAAKLQVKIAHIEAGLRSFNRAMPEEINRVMVDHLSDLLFCPSQTAVNNLAREGITRGIHVVGDVMLDILLRALSLAESRSQIISTLGLSKSGFLLATIHRAENADDPLRLADIARAFNSLNDIIVFPVHPRTRKMIEENAIVWSPHVRLIEPLGYLDMITLEKSARIILTDSGGMQKEAYWLGVPCLTLRNDTEWVETIESRWNKLVGADTSHIIDAVHTCKPPETRRSLYGDGNAAERIAAIITSGEG